jgi:hypothetical protein
MDENILRMMENDFEEKEATSIEKMDQKSLKTVAELAREIVTQETRVDFLEQSLKDAKKGLLKLTDQELPNMLAEIGLTKMVLEDGSEVTVKQTYGASILVDNRPKAYDWLREHGYDDIIKNVVSCQFGRGEDEKALAFKAVAENEGYPADQKTDIHSGTLRAFVKELCEAGVDFPMELFGAYIGQRAIIKKGVK